MASTVSSFPIDFDLYNANEEQVLFITDDVAGQDLTLEVTNTSDKPVTPQPLTGAASASNHHFELIFRPATLYNNPAAINLKSEQFELFMNIANGVIQPNADGTLSLFFKSKGNWTLQQGEKLLLKISNIRAEGTDGTRGTRVMLKYRNLLHTGNPDTFSGFREMHLNIVNHRGKQNIPLHVGFVGANTVLNDGKSSTTVMKDGKPVSTLKLRISNASRKDIAIEATAKSKLTLVMEGGPPTEEWTLATASQLDKAAIKYKRPGDPSFIEAVGTTVWEIPFVKLQKGQFIDIEIFDLITDHPTGHANLYLHYEDIPGYWNGERVVIIEKTPLVFNNKNAGIGTTPEMKLDVLGSIGVKNAANWDHLFIEHDGATAYINAGGAESGMVLRVGNAATGSYKGQTYTEVLRLLPNGNVGIGTTNPEAKLAVVPPKDGRGIEILSPSAGNTHLPWVDNWNYISGNGVIFRDAAHAEKMRIDSKTGNMGVGTANPEAKLQVINQNQNGYGNTLILGPTNASNLRLGYGAENSWIQSHGNKPLAINPEGNNVGVGVYQPAARLDVNGNLLTRALNVNSNRQFNKILAGHAHCGSHGGGVKEVRIDFPQAFTLKPMCVCTIRGEGYSNDTFAVTVKFIDTTHFKVNIVRVDAHMGGWGQNLRLDWVAFEIEGLTGF